jgi:Ca2+-binding RTX toxin-like protein
MEGLPEKKEKQMRRTIVLLTTMALTLLVATSVALAAVISCPNGNAGFCRGTSSADTMTGTDTIDFNNGDTAATTSGDQIYGLSGSDTLYGKGGPDALHGAFQADKLDGGAGNDQYWFEEGWGDDTITADASGVDVLRFDKHRGGVDVRLLASSSYSEATPKSGFQHITLNWVPTGLIEGVWGGTGSDTLSGNNGDNDLYGGGGNDKLNGGAGRDYFSGGAGDDTINAVDRPAGAKDRTISCGPGNDTVHYDRGFEVPFGDCEKKIGYPINAAPTN